MRRERGFADFAVFLENQKEKSLLTAICERGLRLFREKIARHCLSLTTNLSVALLTTTIFLGGSYLFFIQLAEYGW